MPYTKRIVIHAGDKGQGLYNVINYASNEEKTDYGLLKTGVNCSAVFAETEFKAIQRKFHKEDDDRVAYHIIQSFDISDPITAEEANEIGVRLCKTLYSDFQCLVTTHIDRGHLHNHIVVNAVNLKGRKLVDRLADPKEGLYALRNASDQIGLQYGCHLIKGYHPIGKYRAKNYDSNKKFMYDVTNVNWKSTIIQKIEELKETVNSFDELLEGLSLEGYEIKRGKHISVRPYGKQRFTRLYKLSEDEKYSEESLRSFFINKEQNRYQYKTYKWKNRDSVLHKEIDLAARQSQEAVTLSSKGQKANRQYPKFYNSRYMEVKRYNELIRLFNILNEFEIYSQNDLEDRIQETMGQLEASEKEYEEYKALTQTFVENEPFAKIYMETYNQYKVYEQLVNIVGYENAEQTEAVKLHLSAKKELNNAELDEVREFFVAVNKAKREAHHQNARIYYLKSKLTDLNKVKSKTLENQGYIKSLFFSEKMIDKERSNNEYYCVKLPYTKLYVYLPKKCIAWNKFGVSATMYLIDDEEYILYDELNQEAGKATGDQLEQISDEQRKETQEYYSALRADREGTIL